MLTFVSTAYNEYYDPYMFISSLLLQTNNNWKCIIYCDGDNQHILNIVNHFNDSRITYKFSEKNNGCWGHYNRLDSINNLITTEFFIQTSIQDYYLPNTVDLILNNSEYDLIHFNALHNHFEYNELDTTLNVGGIDWGCYAVRTSIGKTIGISNPEYSGSDGLFAENISKLPNIKIKKINKILTIHN